LTAVRREYTYVSLSGRSLSGIFYLLSSSFAALDQGRHDTTVFR
jgi:hypothetical protein